VTVASINTPFHLPCRGLDFWNFSEVYRYAIFSFDSYFHFPSICLEPRPSIPTVMHPGRSATRSNLLDWSRGCQIGCWTDQSEQPNPRRELYFDTGYAWNLTPIGYRPPHYIYIYMKGHGLSRVISISSTHLSSLLFISKPKLFQPYLLFFLRLYGIRGRSEWPADLRVTLAPFLRRGPSQARGSRFSPSPWSTGLTSPYNRSDRSTQRGYW